MSKHITISPGEAADRLASRELVDGYAPCANRRDAEGQMSLFTVNTHFVVYMNAKDPKPSMDLHSREALAAVFAGLNKYDATTHFVGQSTIFTLTGDRGTGEAYCRAHHVTVDGGRRRLMVASRRYLDTFVKMDDTWLFAESLLFVDWQERPRRDRSFIRHEERSDPGVYSTIDLSVIRFPSLTDRTDCHVVSVRIPECELPCLS